MNDALRMDEHLDSFCRNAKQPLCLNHLKTLIHHRCGVNRDFGTHIPSGMLQGICLCDVGYLIHRLQAERTTRCRQQYLFNLIVTLAHDTLEDGRMLTVNRQYRRMVFVGQLADQFTGHNQRLLVGKAYLLTGLDGMNGR